MAVININLKDEDYLKIKKQANGEPIDQYLKNLALKQTIVKQEKDNRIIRSAVKKEKE